MAWTTPTDWTAAQLVTATNLNTQLRDNMIALKTPPSDQYTANEAGEYSGAAAWADVDTTNFTLTLATTGGNVMIAFNGTVYMTAGTATFYFDVDVDGTPWAGDDGIIGTSADTGARGVSFCIRVTGLAAGNHTFVLRWLAAAAGRLAAGSGATHDVHPQFWAAEIG